MPRKIHTDRPAIALVIYPGQQHSPRVLPGYWQPDATWADPDNGPGAAGLLDSIGEALTEHSLVSVVCQSFTGELTRSYHYNQGPPEVGPVDLPTDPRHEADDAAGGRDVQPDDFTLSIGLGNAEMLLAEHVADAVRGVAQAVADGDTDGNVFDANGNTVGSWTLALPDSHNYRVVEETRGEVTFSQHHGDDLAAACGALLELVGGEQGMPGDTVDELRDHMHDTGEIVVKVGGGCVWRLIDVN